jgi:dihydroxyacetone kinase
MAIMQGEGVLIGTPNKDSYSGTSISSSMVAERKSRIGDESASYVVPDDVTVDILSSA